MQAKKENLGDERGAENNALSEDRESNSLGTDRDSANTMASVEPSPTGKRPSRRSKKHGAATRSEAEDPEQ